MQGVGTCAWCCAIQLQPFPEKMRLGIVNEMQIEILNGGEILVHYSKSRHSNSSVSRGTSSNWDFDWIEFLCISRYKFKFGFWFHLNLQLTKISPPFRISICVSLTIWCLVFSGTGWAVLRNRKRERWGAGVEYHFQEIEWALRPVVNGT